MKTLVAFLFLAMAGSASAGEVETLIGYTLDSDGITYQVFSGGCTKKEDFQVLPSEVYPVGLSLVRNKPDHCESFAYLTYGIKVKFSWKEIGINDGTEIVIQNPMIKSLRVQTAN